MRLQFQGSGLRRLLRYGWALYVKDLAMERGQLAALSGLVILWQLFLISGLSHEWRMPEPEEMLGVGVIVPGLLLPFWTVFSAYNGLRTEWAGRHSQLLLSLPVPRCTLLVVKLAVVMTGATLLSAVTVLGAALIFRPNPYVVVGLVGQEELVPLGALLAQGLKIYLLFWLGLLAGAAATQFAYLVGRLLPRRAWLLNALAFIGGLWLMLRFGTLVGAFSAHPDAPWPRMTIVWWQLANDFLQVLHLGINLAPIGAALIVALGLFLFGCWLLDRLVDA